MANIVSNKSKSLQILKSILLTASFLSIISKKLTTRFAVKLFCTPLKHKIPKRELEMDAKSTQKLVFIPAINKSIVVYEYGHGNQKILLSHGWSGRGTQLVKIADAFLDKNYMTISFDAPGHGKSAGNNTIMLEFIEIILALEKIYGKFEAAVGHSLGGIALLNSTKLGLKINQLVTIGAADKIEDILNDFTQKIGLKPLYNDLMKAFFEKKYNRPIESLSAYLSAKEIDIPVLVIHDQDDDEVPVFCAENIIKHLKNKKYIRTKGLGHRRILGDAKVIEAIVDFVHSNDIIPITLLK